MVALDVLILAVSLHPNLFWPTSVPVPCQCNGFALIMQGREEKSHAERERVHVWEKIGSDRCSVHRFACRFRGHDGGFESAHMWIWKCAHFDELKLNSVAPISPGLSGGRDSLLYSSDDFQWVIFPPSAPTLSITPIHSQPPPCSILAFHTLSSRKHVEHVRSGGVKWASLIKQPVTEVNSSISGMRKHLGLKRHIRNNS